MSENIHEELARYKKATALADALQAAKIDSDTAKTFTDQQILMTAQMAEVNYPSDLTWSLAVDLLRFREASRDRLDERNQSDLIPNEQPESDHA